MAVGAACNSAPPFITPLICFRRRAGLGQPVPDGVTGSPQTAGPASSGQAYEPSRSRILAGPPSCGERFETPAAREARLVEADMAAAAAAAAKEERARDRQQEEASSSSRVPMCTADELPDLIENLGLFPGHPGETGHQRHLARSVSRVHKAHRAAKPSGDSGLPRHKRGSRANTVSLTQQSQRRRSSGSPKRSRRHAGSAGRHAVSQEQFKGIEGSSPSSASSDFESTLDPASLIAAATPPKRKSGKRRALTSAEKTTRPGAIQTECLSCGRPLNAGKAGRCRSDCSGVRGGGGGRWRAGMRSSGQKKGQKTFADAGTVTSDSTPVIERPDGMLDPRGTNAADAPAGGSPAARLAAADLADAAVAAAVAAHAESSPRQGHVAGDRSTGLARSSSAPPRSRPASADVPARTPASSGRASRARASAQPSRQRFSGRVVCNCGNVLAPDSAFCRKCGARRPGSEAWSSQAERWQRSGAGSPAAAGPLPQQRFGSQPAARPEAHRRNPVPLDYLQTLQDGYGPGRGRPPAWSSVAAAPVSLPGPNLGFDEATWALERLVEETHQTLVRDGLIQDVAPIPSSELPGPAGSHGMRDSHVAAPHVIPSLDAVDRALEELQRGLVEIDTALARPIGSTRDASSTERGARA
mmetsp:Transcript_153618/g.271122  ORF Transcript_153618/g.271122 Transcript_153618/m.271122 type:complete len:643 (-) Transcript_153618:60-1988(-)